MRRDAGDTLYVCMGPMEIPVAIVEALDAPRQLTSCSLPERQLRTTYTLDDENGGTRIVVALHGFEALPADTRQDRVEPTLAGWERGLANLQAHVAGEQLPYPEGYVAAMFGYRRVTPRVYAIERSIWIAASCAISRPSAAMPRQPQKQSRGTRRMPVPSVGERGMAMAELEVPKSMAQ